MIYFCAVCHDVIAPDERGQIRLEGITGKDASVWLWGPVPVHDECRTKVRALDGAREWLDGPGVMLTWERIPA